MTRLVCSPKMAAAAKGAALALFTLLLGAAAGCGGAPPPPPVDPNAGRDRDREEDTGPDVEGEIGGLDEARVKQTFERAGNKVGECFHQGAERVPFMSGEVHFMLRIKKDGTPRFAFIKDSNLGDRVTEACMLDVLKGLSWPKPKGGEGLAENSYTFEASPDERAPVEWTEDKLGKPYQKARSMLAECRTDAGAGPIKATMYVTPKGRAQAVGLSSADEKGEEAASCVIDTLKALTYPSPGSYAAKVSITIE